MLQNVFEGLVTFDANNQVVPQLALSWEIGPDGKTYTFHLRKDARFHNGRAFGAADVKYSLERALRPETKSVVASNYLAGIAGSQEVAEGKRRDLPGVEIVDPFSVRILLDKPRGYFLGALAYPTGWIVCKEAIEANGGELNEKSGVGTGPFVFSEYRHGAKLIFKAFPNHYLGKPPLDRIERPILRDPQTVHMMYDTDALDMCGVTPGDYLRDRNDPRLKPQLHVLPSTVVAFLVMQPKLEPVFANPKVRRAIAQAIDRDEIVRVASQGIWVRADGFLPPKFPGYNPNLRKIPLEPAGARKLLAEAGFPNGRGFPQLTMVYGQSSPEISAAAQIIRNNLRQNLGITINLQEQESGTLRTAMFDRRIAFTIGDWGADYIDPQNYLSMLLRTGAKLNFFGYSNPQFDALCDKADAESDMKKRIPLYQQADQIETDEVSMLPLFYGNFRILVKPWVKNWQRDIMSYLPHHKTRIDHGP